MADQRLTFTLAGRDELSRAMNGAASSADRLRLRLAGITADSDGQLRDLQGRFLAADEAARRLADGSTHTRSSLMSVSDSAKKLGEALKASLISLAPAAIPASAALAGAAAQIATQLGAAGLAAGAYALALKPQITAITDTVSAQDAYDKAVKTSGATSQAAATAQAAYQKQLAALPPATQKAAVAVGLLKDNYQDWSDSLSGDVLAPFTKGVAVVNALLPKTSGLVQGASTQFDRLITLVGGAINTPGFDNLTGKVTDFADKTLDNAVDELTIFLAKVDTGKIGNGITEFLDYAHANGPAVWSTLENVGEALIHVLQAGSDVGVGMLDVINALSGIVAAVPPQGIAALLQLAIAIKAVKLASAGGSVISAMVAQIVAARAAAAGASGPVAGLGASFGALSKSAKAAVAGTGIGLLLIGLSAISSSSKKAPPDVDKLTTSLKTLGDTGKVTGEAARAFGKDLSGLGDSLEKVADPKGLDRVQQDIISFFGTDSTPIKEAKENVDAFDKALAGLVSSGNAKLAAAALQDTIGKLQAQGKDTSKLRGQLDDYKDALAGQALEQKLAAQSMGLFGDQAQKTQAALDRQKDAAQGLQQAIFDLNDTNRSAYDAETKYQQAIDDATKTIKENGKTLDANSEKGRNNRDALSSVASSSEAVITALVQQGASWETVSKKSSDARAQFIKVAMSAGDTREEATKLADKLLKIPDKTVYLKGQVDDLNAKIKSAQKTVDSLRQKRKTAVGADKTRVDAAIKAAQAKVDSLKQKRAAAIKASNQVGPATSAAQRAINSVHGRTVTLTTIRRTVFESVIRSGGSSQAAKNAAEGFRAQGGLIHRAAGGLVPRFPGGGLLFGPGTSTSDSIPIMASNGEYVIKAAAVARYGAKFFDALNAGNLPVGRSAPRPGLPAAVASDRRPPVDERPLIGTLSVQTGPNASADDIVSAALFEARVARRRGVYG